MNAPFLFFCAITQKCRTVRSGIFASAARSFCFVSSINFQGENVKLNFMNYDFTNGMFSDSANGMLSDSAKINFAKIPAVRSSGDFTKGEDISNSFLFCLILV